MRPADLSPYARFGEEKGQMVRLGELMMILELHRQGLSITAIARRTGRDPKTVRKYIEQASKRRLIARVLAGGAS